MTQPTPLTVADIAVFKTAAKDGLKIGNRSYLVARYMGETQTFSVTVGLTKRQPEGYEPSEVTLSTDFVTLGQNEVYSRGERVRVGEDAPTHFVTSQTHGYHGPRISALGSLANVLRAGDELFVAFVIGNDSEKMREVGLTKDEAYVSIVRNGKFIISMSLGSLVSNGARFAGMVAS